MPKLKTHSSSKKRFMVTGKGKVKVKPAHTRHRLISKPKAMKRKAKGTRLMSMSDIGRVLVHLLPYSRKRRNRTVRIENNTAAAESKES